MAGKPTIVVRNKIDLLDLGPRRHGDTATFEPPISAPPNPRVPHSQPAATVATSALTGAGLSQLAEAVAAALLGGAPSQGSQMVSNPRHRDALARAAGHVRDALGGRAAGIPADLLAVDLTAALAAIGEITGDGVHDDLLAAIFSTFCIGK